MVPLPLAVEVEIGVVGEVEHGGFVGAGVVVDAKPAAVERIGYGDVGPGVAFSPALER